MSISTYVAGFYARMDNLTQLRMPDELKGHLLLNQANFGPTEKAMIVASAKGSFKIGGIVDSMRQLFGDRNDIPIESTSFVANNDLKRFCNYCKKKNHVEKDCWKNKKNEKETALNQGGTTTTGSTPNSSKKSTYVTFLSRQKCVAPLSALIDSGAVHNIVGKSTLDTMMSCLRLAKVEKCQTLQMVHRFGAHGTPIEPEFGVIIPWTCNDIEGKSHSFNFRADVLEGDHPFLIGCPTLVAMKAVLHFDTLVLNAEINGTQCSVQLLKRGNHIYIDHVPLIKGPIIGFGEDQDHGSNYYGMGDLAWTQFFQGPDHC
jgi:hypothetical protein